MISIRRDNGDLAVRIETNLPLDCEGKKSATFVCTFAVGYPYNAELLKRHIQALLSDHLEAIRFAAYEAGWGDAKAKRKKKTHMSTGWHPDIVGY